MIKYILISLFFGLSVSKTFAAESKEDHVLDFEGEVIEGERKKPDLFLQISTKDIDFGSLIYLRKNFNDYLEVDRKSRNRYFKVKGK